MECWKETIASATHFVYIENQFFLSSLAATGVQNTLAQVLLDKLVEAANAGRVFRAVIIIPLHPEVSFLFGQHFCLHIANDILLF